MEQEVTMSSGQIEPTKLSMYAIPTWALPYFKEECISLEVEFFEPFFTNMHHYAKQGSSSKSILMLQDNDCIRVLQHIEEVQKKTSVPSETSCELRVHSKLQIGDGVWYIDKGGDFDPPCVKAVSVVAEACDPFVVLSDKVVRKRKDLYTDPGDPGIETEILNIIKQKIALVEERLEGMRKYLEAIDAPHNTNH